MDQPRSYYIPHESDGMKDAAANVDVAKMMEENREGLAMKVIAVIVERYGRLPKELWDLNSISDMGAGRGFIYRDASSQAIFESLISSERYSIVNLTIVKEVTVEVELPPTLCRLEVLARHYNFPLDLPENLQELSLMYYNRPLLLPDKLQKLKLGDRYTPPPFLSPTMNLGFMYKGQFNLPVALPAGLVSLDLGDAYNQPILLPNGIEEVRVGSDFTHDLPLPSSVRTIEWRCNRAIQIPEGVIEIDFHCRFNQPVMLPASLKKLTFAVNRYSHRLDFPAGLKELFWHTSKYEGFVLDEFQEAEEDDGYEGLVLPARLQKLAWGSAEKVRLPSGLKELVLTKDAPVIPLPEGLLKVTFERTRPPQGYHKLPESVQEVMWIGPSNERVFFYPETLQHLIIRAATGLELNLTWYKVHKITVASSGIKITHWPLALKEVVFTVDAMDHPMRLPKGCVIVGERRPRNVIMD